MIFVNDLVDNPSLPYRSVMKKFTIKDLERFSDIKAHTLRTWEFRYSIIKPQRSNTNLRFYTIEEVKRILNISLLNRRGWKVSALAQMCDEAVNEKVSGINDDDFKQEKAVMDLLMHMYEMESEKFEDVLDNCLLQWNNKTVFCINDIIQIILIGFNAAVFRYLQFIA